MDLANAKVMRVSLLGLALVLSLAACGRSETDPQARIDATRSVEPAPEKSAPLSDAGLEKIVREALESESSLDARKIRVQNRNGVVTLQGAVQSEEQREKAGRIVGSVGGVKTVDNRLAVDTTLPDPGASTGGTAGPPELPK